MIPGRDPCEPPDPPEGAETPSTPTAPPLSEYAALAQPRYLAAALVFEALRTLGDYPEDAPAYDRPARDLLMQALERLAPGLGNPKVLGLPVPSRRAAPEEPAPPAAPVWVADVLGEQAGPSPARPPAPGRAGDDLLVRLRVLQTDPSDSAAVVLCAGMLAGLAHRPEVQDRVRLLAGALDGLDEVHAEMTPWARWAVRLAGLVPLRRPGGQA